LGRTIVVGDLHGCFDELSELLDALGFGGEDRVVCVGDLITKGEKSREVLDLFMSDARFQSVLGNHDRALLAYWRGEIEKKKLKRAQKKCAKQLKEGKELYAAYLSTLPAYVDLGSHVVVHAGLRPGVPLSAQSVEDLTEIRTLGRKPASRKGTPWYEAYDGEKFALFGHWPAAAPRRGPRALGLDTGCVYGHRLTAYVLETGELHSVAARRIYDTR
jgi:Calcineurin-like phosphoesterase